MHGCAGGTPFETGLLQVADGQLSYWEQSGNPAGKPLLILHGGPGGHRCRAYRRLLIRTLSVGLGSRGRGTIIFLRLMTRGSVTTVIRP
jgi:pimeloyl-ACP methyl ester carboxylesterase